MTGLPHLACSVFYKQMYGTLNEVVVPGNYDDDITVNGLDCGRTYQVYARCTNLIGDGAISRQISQKTLGVKPSPPDTESDFLRPSNVSVRLDLYAWNDDTCPVSYFVVEYRKRRASQLYNTEIYISLYTDCFMPFFQDEHWTLVSNNLEPRSRRFSIRQLSPETSYELRVRANNAGGSSERTYSFDTVSRSAAGERLGSGSLLDASDGRSGGKEGTFLAIPGIIAVLLVAVAIFFGIIVFRRREYFIHPNNFFRSQFTNLPLVSSAPKCCPTLKI